MSSTHIPFKSVSESTISSHILFTPGMSCDKRLWDKIFNLMPTIGPKQFIDFAGCTVLPEFIQKISEGSNEKFNLVGFSMGGYIAIEYALQYPESISSLVLVSCSARGYTESEKKQRQQLIDSAREKFEGLVSHSRLMNMINPKHLEKESILTTMELMMRDMGVKTLIDQQTATLNRVDRRDALSKLKLPILIIQGRDDRLVSSAETENLVSKVPLAQLEIIDNCGHMVPLECPSILADLLSDWFENK